MYGFCRPDTYIGNVLSIVIPAHIPSSFPLYGFFAWYLPDFLWMFALTCTLFGVLLPKRKALVGWSCFSLGCGIAWEVAQLYGVTTGTADFWDVVMYIIAVFLAFMIKIKK